MKKTILIFAAFLSVLFVGFSTLKAKAVVGYNIGDKVPHNLQLKNSYNDIRDLNGLSGSKGFILVFVRSADWCPFCQNQLIDLERNRERFEEKGYKIVTLSYDSTEILHKFQK